MKLIKVVGVMGAIEEMVELDTGIIVPKKVALDMLDEQIKEMEDLRDISLSALQSNPAAATLN